MNTGDIRVLVIDDEALVRSVVGEALRDEGYNVMEAEDGAVGCALLRQHPFDLVITDIVMPTQDGLETILAIHRAHPDLPILAMSGGGRYAWTDVLETAATFGASRTLEKPFTLAALIAAVREMLNGTDRSTTEGDLAA